MFERLTNQIKAEQEIHAILLNAQEKDAAWATIQSIASNPPLPGPDLISAGFRRLYAQRLVDLRAAKGDAAAMALAQSTKNYPTIVKER